jgi:membrane protease YdiL (CAAX protease family)
VIVAARWAATRLGLDPRGVGAVFGVALAWPAIEGGWRALARIRSIARGRLPRLRARNLVLGSIAGIGLAGIASVAPALGGTIPVRGLGAPAAPFVPWAVVTILVAVAEEGLLRGALFDRLARIDGHRGTGGQARIGGPALAIAVTTLAFALLHVPLYGWHVVPLDLAVGLVLGGLRLGTRGVAAPAAAHAVADLASWWL